MKRIMAISLPLLVFISLILNLFLFSKKNTVQESVSKNQEDDDKRIRFVVDKFFDDNKKYFDTDFYTSIKIEDGGKLKNFMEYNPVVKQCIKISFIKNLDEKFTETFEKETQSEQIKTELREYYYKLKKQIDKEKQILYDAYPAKLSKIDKMYLDQIK